MPRLSEKDAAELGLIAAPEPANLKNEESASGANDITGGAAAGASLGSLAGPEGTAVGAVAGAAFGVGKALYHAKDVSKGPGGTLDSGSLGGGTSGEDNASAVAESLRHLATTGMKSFAPAKGKGNKF